MELPKSLKEVKSVTGVNPSFLGYLLSKIDFKKVCVIFPDPDSAREFYSSTKVFTSYQTAFLPSQDLPPFSEVIADSDFERDRIWIWSNLKNIKVLIGSVEAFLRKFPPLEYIKRAYLYLITGEELNRDELLKHLLRLGYERVGVVEEPGTFTAKGGVVDVWPGGYQNPVRLELAGSKVISIKTFSPETQRSISNVEEVSIYPVKELFFPENTKEVFERFISLKSKLTPKRASEVLAQLEQGTITENSEFLLPLFFPKLQNILSALNGDWRVILFEPEKVKTALEKFIEGVYLGSQRAKAKGKLFFSEWELYTSEEEFFSSLKDYIRVSTLPLTDEKAKCLSFELKYRSPDLISGKENRLEKAFNLLKKALENREKVVLVVSDKRTQKAIEDGLRYRSIEEGEIEFKQGDLREGFFYPQENLWVTSDFELFGKARPKVSKETGIKKAKRRFRSFEDLSPGDYVVHRVHGIGRYLGLKVIEVGGQKGEFLEIEYQNEDKLYLPVYRLDELYPYVGVADKEPKLDKLGKQTFLNRRKKVEKELKDVVQELLSLYAERKTLKSYSISFPSLVYEEFAATFPYEETPDQRQAIDEVISDLCSEKPMERLLVGDVGFGKTEVALRAAFLVAYAGKQVAFLVPTTILAEQHYRNFKSRLELFGIKVGVLSRLRSREEQKQTLKELAEGKIKVIIGTHRLLSPDVTFKDLGLLVIDEEHRFGVKQKERIKQLKKSVKVLILSATPIPRSLQLSLLGIFDLSVIESPPSGRKPVKTVLAKFDPEIIRYAIEQELERGGQIFFVNPRIQGLFSLANYVKKLVPQAKVEVIHGQMPSDVIEKNLYRFLNRDVDVLVCTPIIGSGIDIPSANTIIINRADMFGVADIYQLRGRVGRSTELGYAYLLVPSLKNISEEAQKRLKALLKFTDLGSGFKLAMSDLKIRGAGQLLGIKQSGHINTVGYELYLELLENTIKELKGEEIQDWEPEVNVKVPAYIPVETVPEPRERLALYRELVIARDEEELKEFEELFRDKYGELPKAVENLINIFRLKIYMKRLNIPFIENKGRDLVLVIKDKEKLLKFRKLSKMFKFITKNDKTVTKLIFKNVEDPLKSAIEICKLSV